MYLWAILVIILPFLGVYMKNILIFISLLSFTGLASGSHCPDRSPQKNGPKPYEGDGWRCFDVSCLGPAKFKKIIIANSGSALSTATCYYKGMSGGNKTIYQLVKNINMSDEYISYYNAHKKWHPTQTTSGDPGWYCRGDSVVSCKIK